MTKKTSCKNNCKRIGWFIDRDIIRPIVASEKETEKGGWHTACPECAHDHFRKLPRYPTANMPSVEAQLEALRDFFKA